MCLGFWLGSSRAHSFLAYCLCLALGMLMKGMGDGIEILTRRGRYTKTELAKRAAIFHMTSPLGSAFGGYLVSFILGINHIKLTLVPQHSKQQYINRSTGTLVSRAGDGCTSSVDV